jgi:CRP/FNR family nitrogen fixation transcriptional regulator
MYMQSMTTPRSGLRQTGWSGGAPDVAHSGQLDQLIALEQIGTRLSYPRNHEIYGQGEQCGFWYKVVSGSVRVSKLLADGRRQIVEFCFSDDAFGLESGEERAFSAEALSDVVVMRYSRSATERLNDEDPAVARGLREMTLRSLAAAQDRLLLLGRMTASERVASFLLELSERNDGASRVELPMSRCDIGDYLGITIETVCRALSDLKRRGIIAIQAHLIELCDRDALEAIAEE